MALDPTQNPQGIGHTLDGRQLTDEQRLQVLLTQLNDPQRNPESTPELQREIARMQKIVGTPEAAPGQKIVTFEGQQYPFPADATDEEIAEALAELSPPAPAAPRASQADVRRTEPKLSPGQTQEERVKRWNRAYDEYAKYAGQVPKNMDPGAWFRMTEPERVEWLSGVQNPAKTENKAMVDELAAGGDLRYGDSAPYAAAKFLAAVGGGALGGSLGARGGPVGSYVGVSGGATLGEAAVRFTTIAFNLKKAVDAGAITEDRAAEIMTQEMKKGVGEDALFNFGAPLLGQLAAHIPGMRWLAEKVAAKIGAIGPKEQEVVQRQTALNNLGKKAEKAAETPQQGAAARQAVQEIGARTKNVVPTPGQVTGQASTPEIASRVASPGKFQAQQNEIAEAVRGMRDDAVNPAMQPSAKALGEQIAQVAEKTQQAVKQRLRPTFEEANRIGVSVDLKDVLQVAEDALARNGKVPGGQLKPSEIAKLRQIVDDLRVPAQPAGAPAPSALLGANGKPAYMTPGSAAVPAGVKKVDAEAALDFLSARKADTRAITADGVPSTPFVRLMDMMVKKGEQAYQTAAASAGRGDVVKRLTDARLQYSEMMDSVYEDAVKAALKKNPEDVGRLFWQAGNVSELEQLQKLLGIARREKVMTPAGAQDLSRAMARGFLQEAVPDVNAAAKWSETLKANPLKRRTWETLTAAPGGSQLRGAMEVLEQAAKMAQRDNPELIGQMGMAAIPLRRAAGLGLGVSYVTGVIHPGMLVAGFSVDGLLKLMATAYTQGNKGVLNAIARALRANNAGTVAAAKALQETLPVIEKFAAQNGEENIFVGKQEQQ